MGQQFTRNMSEPIRSGMSTNELWSGPDNGLFLCWELGRKKAEQAPGFRTRAKQGELLELCWARGSWNYLAYWQGLRGEDLLIDTDQIFDKKCPVSGRSFPFGGTREERLRRQHKLDAQLNKEKKQATLFAEQGQ